MHIQDIYIQIIRIKVHLFKNRFKCSRYSICYWYHFIGIRTEHSFDEAE